MRLTVLLASGQMNFVPNGECFNPTEAGGRDDSQSNSTHTVIQEVHAAGDSLRTKVGK